MKHVRTILEYSNVPQRDEARRDADARTATVIVASKECSLVLVGDRARFALLRQMLNELLDDWS